MKQNKVKTIKTANHYNKEFVVIIQMICTSVWQKLIINCWIILVNVFRANITVHCNFNRTSTSMCKRPTYLANELLFSEHL